MAVLDLNCYALSAVGDSIDATVRKLEKRVNDYTDISSKVGSVSSSTGNLRDCNIYLRKKAEKLEGKISKLKSFKQRVNTLGEHATKADQRVAEHITEDTSKFYKAAGIKTGWRGTLQSIGRAIVKGCKTICRTVKDFYEKHKYTIDLVIDAVLVVAAVVAFVAAWPTGILATALAAFSLVDAIGDYVCSVAAWTYHRDGNDKAAEIWAERGLRDGFKWVGSRIDKWTGTDFCEDILAFTYDALNLLDAANSIFEIGVNAYKAIKKKSFVGVFKAIIGWDTIEYDRSSLRRWQHISQFFEMGNIQKAKEFDSFTKIFKNVAVVAESIKQTGERKAIGEGVKLYIEIKDMYESFKNICLNDLFYCSVRSMPKLKGLLVGAN